MFVVFFAVLWVKDTVQVSVFVVFFAVLWVKDTVQVSVFSCSCPSCIMG